MDATSKSLGVTETERMLADFCERSFLKLWTYPNPYKDDGKELCDVLAVFGNHVFVFFDREKAFSDAPDDPKIAWDRWKRRAIDRQVVTAHGAERYIRSGRSIFLDAKQAVPFPLVVNWSTAIVHKIVVAHGAKDACKRSSNQNVYGSLAVTYCDPDKSSEPWPFHVVMDRQNPVHLFDSHNLPIILGELDTISDFSRYLDEKVRAIKRFDVLSYCGEEDLLGHYLLNFDKKTNEHVIGSYEPLNGVMIGEGEWHEFVQSGLYKNTKREDEVSYFWDELIQRTCQNALDGTLGGNSDLLRGQSAIVEMVREPRFARRALSSKMQDNVINFPDTSGLTRHVSFMPSIYPDVGYVFFQLRAPDEIRSQPDYLDKRRSLLEIACGAARNKFPHLNKVIGIGMDAPKFAGDTNSEDFILMPCEKWRDETRLHYQELNKDWRFFDTDQLQRHEQTVTQFVPPTQPEVVNKVGRNEPCPCGSGKKYKKCHG
ncbi:MAG: SEC-C metal-binding domain-containing protein [Pseudoxanthomonas sp.]